MADSNKLLRQYAETGDERAFAQLVQRYVNLVYSTALRQMGGRTQSAEDVTQMVFAHLARKARRVSERVVLGGWLYQDTIFTAAKLRRSEARRQTREREAAIMHATNETSAHSAWTQLEPLLDEAMRHLRSRA